MVRIRIGGLVRAAREARQRLLSGFEMDERSVFLERMGGLVARADEILAANGCEAACLAAPSRAALSKLRAIAQLSPGALTAPDPARPTRTRLQLKNVVRSMNFCLDRLATGRVDEATFQDVLLDADISADGIERVCELEGGHTADLPTPSRRAYAMLRWLSREENLEFYIERVELAVDLVPSLWERVSGVADPMPARVWFKPSGPLLRKSLRRDHHAWALSLGCLSAEQADLHAILACMVRGRDATDEMRARRTTFLGSAGYGALGLEFDFLADPTPFQPRGRAYDLERLFEKLDQAYFGGRMEKPHLHWRETNSRRTFGLYYPAMDLVCLNPILDDPEVPEFVAETVLYHELLHKKHGVRVIGGCAHAHTPAFRAEERLHPRLAEGDRWIDALASGASRPVAARPPEARPSEARPSEKRRAESHPPESRTAESRRSRRLSQRPPEPSPALTRSGRPGRNAPCWCGGGRKYKHCHLTADVSV